MDEQNRTHSKRAFPWLFFGLSYGMSWVIWGLIAAAGVSPSPLLLHWLYNFYMSVVMLMGFLPLQVAVIKTVVSLVLCILVVAIWGAQTMTRHSNSTQTSKQETSHA